MFIRVYEREVYLEVSGNRVLKYFEFKIHNSIHPGET